MQQPDTPPENQSPGSDPMAGFERLGTSVDRVGTVGRSVNAAAAVLVREIEAARRVAEQIQSDSSLIRYRTRDAARRMFMTGIALELRISEQSAGKKIALGQVLVATLTRTLDTLAEGTISERHAFAIAQYCDDLTPESMLAFEDRVLPKAVTMTPVKFERFTRQQRERLHPELMATAHMKALEERRVELFPLPAGMAQIVATMDATRAVGLINALEDDARALKNVDGETRTLAQLRADVFADRFVDSYRTSACGNGADTAAETGMKDGKKKTSGRSNGIYGGFAPRVNIMVPALSLLGKSDEPAVLAGYGPIDLETARELVGEAKTWRRILTDPETGQMLSMSSTKYRPPTDLADAVRLRDGTCREPGCNNPAEACEIDHSTAWEAGGVTEFLNLGAFCRKHHKVKHFELVAPDGTIVGTAVRIDHVRDEQNRPTGQIRWNTITGHAYISDPQLSARALKKIRDAEDAEKAKNAPPFDWNPTPDPADGPIEPF